MHRVSHELQIQKEKTMQEREISARQREDLEIAKQNQEREKTAREREKNESQLEIEKEISARQRENNKSLLEIEKVKRDQAEAELQTQKSNSEADMEIAILSD